MKRTEVKELHYITPIANLPSICSSGILSHKLAHKVDHESVAMAVIQERRAQKRIPGGLRLHEYANLYINARNKMMYSCKDRHNELCVLRISPDVFDLPGVIVTDRNASSDWVLFSSVREGLKMIDKDAVFSLYWTHTDLIEQYRHGSIMCAEVLVPERVEPTYLVGCYVSCEDALVRCKRLDTGIPVEINAGMFFR
jgi:hypothetical protein